jgi:hypothetical protein
MQQRADTSVLDEIDRVIRLLLDRMEQQRRLIRKVCARPVEVESATAALNRMSVRLESLFQFRSRFDR